MRTTIHLIDTVKYIHVTNPAGETPREFISVHFQTKDQGMLDVSLNRAEANALFEALDSGLVGVQEGAWQRVSDHTKD